MKRILTLLFIVTLFITSSVGVSAADLMSEESTVGTRNAKIWQYEDDWSSGYSYGSWKELTTTYPAQADGETVVIDRTVGTSHSLSGTLTTNSKSIIQASVGVTIGVTESWSLQQWSRPLNKGEYVKASWRSLHKVWTVKESYSPLYGTIESHHAKRYGYLYEALLPQLKLEYFGGSSASSTKMTLEEELIRTEIYSVENGELVLVETIEH